MTSTQTHTPRPWHPERDEWGHNTSGVILGPEGPLGRAYAIPEREANADLFAAAVAMLEALEAGVKLVRELLDSPGILPTPEANAMDDWQADAASDAIAAAKGGGG